MLNLRTCLLSGCVTGLAACGVDAAKITLKPISASSTHVVVGQEIQLTGTPQRVFLEIQISQFAPKEIKTWQSTIESDGYSSGAAGTLTPAFVACAATSTCTSAFGAGAECLRRCVGGANQGQVCSNNGQCPGSTCAFSDCSAGFQNQAHPEWIFEDPAGPAIAAVSTATLDYAYGATTLGGNATDSGTFEYGGTLVLDVPSGAVGTFTVGFLFDPAGTFLVDENNVDIPVAESDLIAARIVVKCAANSQCNDNNTCTTDTCNMGSGMCVNQPTYNVATECCNPANGQTVGLDDGNECTLDVCDPATGIVTHPPKGAGTACGSPANTECDNPDTCNGSGSCLTNLEPNGAACGSPVDNDCDGRDTCNGAGACQTNIQPSGTPCGSPGSGPCDSPDTCNGLAGVNACQPNQVPNNTPCDDSLFCTVNTICTNGSCAGAPRNCADSLTCTTDTCNEGTDQCDNVLDPDRCLIDGQCYVDGQLNPGNTCEVCDDETDTADWTVLPDGTGCNDANACTNADTCTAGECAGVVDPECNDRCDQAVEVIGGTATSNNSSAGPDDAEASCEPNSNRDVWFKYTAVCDGLVFVSTTGTQFTPNNDPVLSVWNNCPADSGAEIACDDDSGLDLNGALTFSAMSGTTYYFRIAGYDQNAGDVVINVHPFDDCVIDGVCYQEDELNPENSCQSCIPDISTTTWSNVAEGTACCDPGQTLCDSDTDCDSPNACDGLGVCELNNKPDNIICTDDGNECSQDFCNTGLCTHPPEPAGLACGSPNNTECDNPDTCNGGGLCVPNYEGAGVACGDPTDDQCNDPDVCNGSGGCPDAVEPSGTPCNDADDCTGSDVCDAGDCAGTSITQAPTLVPFGPLALDVTPQPQNSPGEVALHLTSTTWTCLDLYVQADGTLGPDPVFQLPSEWGTTTIYDRDYIVPSSSYTVVAECGDFDSPPSTAMTRRWGDVNQDGMVDFLDLSLMVDVFRGFVEDPDYEIFDIYGCIPDGRIDFLDISRLVDAFQGDPYPCANPCP